MAKISSILFEVGKDRFLSMGDSWEDDEWDAADLNLDLGSGTASGGAGGAGGGEFDDEVDEVEIEKVEISQPSEATLAAKAKKIAEDEKVLQNQVLYALQEGEGAEDRKARERRQIEEADNALTEELMGGSSNNKSSLSSGSTGLAGISLTTKAEHTGFGITISKKLANSTPQYIAAFYKALTDRLPPKMTGEVLDDMVAVISKVRDEKKAIEGESAKSLNKGKKSAAAKKEAKAKEKRQKEIFGGSDDLDEYYEAYGNLEDDFM